MLFVDPYVQSMVLICNLSHDPKSFIFDLVAIAEAVKHFIFHHSSIFVVLPFLSADRTIVIVHSAVRHPLVRFFEVFYVEVKVEDHFKYFRVRVF